MVPPPAIHIYLRVPTTCTAHSATYCLLADPPLLTVALQVRLVKHPEAHTTPVQAHSTLPRASLAQDNPVFEEDKAPAYSRQQENPLFEEGQGTALSGRGLGGPLFDISSACC